VADFASLEWYAMVANTISQIYLEELGRPADVGGAANWLFHAREGGKDADWIRARIRELEEWHHRHDRPAAVNLPRLVPAGGVFRTDAGGRFTAIEASDFNLFGRFIKEGPDAIEPILQERAAVGFNMLRVWAVYSGNPTFELEIGRLLPSEHADYYDKLPQFLGLCAAHGLYVEFTAFTAGPVPGHWEKCGEALRDVSNVIVELANENDAHPSANLPNIQDYRPLPGIICSHGSNGSQAVPPRPAWDYEVFHTNDAFEWWRKGGHNGMELSQGAEGIAASHKPVIANENTRPDRDGNASHHEDAAAACALLIAGSCFHSQSGKKSALFSPNDRRFAEAHVRGARSVNLECQEGRYEHSAALETPDLLRVYQKVLPDGRRETVKIRK
jgi:hypothetical protein